MYTDTVGKLTIGVGHNLTDKGISSPVANLMLQEDVQEATESLVQCLPWFAYLDEVRQCVLIDMAFNMGTQGLLGFTNTLKAVQEGRYEDARAGMLASEWARQVGHRAVELATMMVSGNW